MLSKNQIRELQSLQQKKGRTSKKLFIVEGIKSVNEIIATKPELLVEVFATKEYTSGNHQMLLKSGIKFSEISELELQKISLQNTPNHVFALCHYLPESKIDFDFNSQFTFYLDDVRDPGNFGTIIRLADWYGIKQIISSPTSCELYNPKVIQSTMGAFMRVKVNYIELETLLKENSIPMVYGALLDGNNLYTQKLRNGLILIGNEANGIQEKNLRFVTQPITIPSAPDSQAESLNAAIAAAIISSEFFRQLKNLS